MTKTKVFLIFLMKTNLSNFLQWKMNVFLYKRLSWKIAFFYICLLGNLFFSLNRHEKASIESALHKVFAGHKDDPEIKAVLKDVFRGILTHYYEKLFNAFSSIEKLNKFLNRKVEDRGLTAIRQALSNGKGVLLVTGHFGGIEFIPAFLAANRCPVTIIVRFSSQLLRQTSLQKAEEFSTRIIDADHTPNIMRAVFDNLRENRIVITQCDEISEWRPSFNKTLFFLGKRIHLDRTIDILLRRYDTSLIFCIMHREKNYHYRFLAHSLEEEEYLSATEGLSTGAKTLKLLEKYIYKNPEQWYQWKKYGEMGIIPSEDNRVRGQSSLTAWNPSLKTSF